MPRSSSQTTLNQTDQLLQEISGKLDRVAKLLSLMALKDIGTDSEKIDVLDEMGFSSNEIAKLVNKTPENVRATLSYVRRKKEKESGNKEQVTQTLAENLQSADTDQVNKEVSASD